MAEHKQAEKRHRQSLVRQERNKHYRSMMRTFLKQAREAVESGAKDKDEHVLKAVSTIDLLASKGIIPRNTASRTVGRLRKAAAQAS
jgi:small subunit ribosomal protein S20